MTTDPPMSRCSRCDQIFPDDPNHPGYPDLHQCDPTPAKFGDPGVVFIQWKGTDVCLDFICECGIQGHFDGFFAYSLTCPRCDRQWVMPDELKLEVGQPRNNVSVVIDVT